MKLVIVGAGGHAKVVLEVFRALGSHDVVGFIAPDMLGAQVLGLPVLGDDTLLPRLRKEGVQAALVALGNNRLRQRIGRQLQEMGYLLPAAVHPSALVSPSARIGQGVVVMARAVVGTETVLQELSILNTGAVVDHDNSIGAAAHIAPGCALAGNVVVGDRTLIGVGTAVRPGIQIGGDVIVGAGSAVVSNLEADCRVGGTPAKPLRNR
ncbi:acetyltransferase [Roseomonas hellenica]|uniref:Acetyltransferase n=2 Tax=Plastoroseomonas hellenica TaxID=2687306 RepID=A0ABS5F1Y6_9PROT|nr:acetyltransferase [Plastoroseomonas hellenica]